jgi:hypothetical protein
MLIFLLEHFLIWKLKFEFETQTCFEMRIIKEIRKNKIKRKKGKLVLGLIPPIPAHVPISAARPTYLTARIGADKGAVWPDSLALLHSGCTIDMRAPAVGLTSRIAPPPCGAHWSASPSPRASSCR